MEKEKVRSYEQKEARKLINHFENLHIRNSKEEYNYRRHDDFYQYKRLVMPHSTMDDESQDENFVKFKSTLINFLKSKHSDKWLLDKPSFAKLRHFSGSIGTGTPINCKEYLEILEISNGWFEYLFNLVVKYGESKKCYVIFRLDLLSKFCLEEFYINFKYASYIINIKKVELEPRQYLYEGEKKHFQEIENLWMENKFENVIQECKGLLIYFIEKYREIYWKKGFTSIERQEKEIGEVLQRVADNFEIEIMGKDLREIFNRFRNMRNKFGKKEAKSSEKDKILMDNFKKTPYSSKKVCTRLLIDQLKTFHNVLVISPDIANLLDDNKEKE
jgi:hypothetical protein